MTRQEIEMFMMQRGSCFRHSQIPLLQELLSKNENISLNDLWTVPLKNPETALLLAIAGGTLGIDRFWLKQPLSAVLKLLITLCFLVFYMAVSLQDEAGWVLVAAMLGTMTAMFVWYILDILSASRRAQTINYTAILACLTH